MAQRTDDDSEVSPQARSRSASNDTESGADRRLDVREIDGEPFDAITEALADLPTDETLLLVNSFEPTPLYDVLEERGFDYRTEAVSAEEWHLRITRG